MQLQATTAADEERLNLGANVGMQSRRIRRKKKAFGDEDFFETEIDDADEA